MTYGISRDRLATSLLAFVLAQFAVACGGPESTAQRADPVVYGSDDRRDVYAHPDAQLRSVAQQSIVALMTSDILDTLNPNDVRLLAGTVGEANNLCSGVRFANDPAAAFCSGTLVDDDVVITAGHCITNATDCSGARIVFNYYRDGASTLHTITTQDVFRCQSIIAQRLDDVGTSPRLDYAVIRLDRSATPRFTPASVRAETTALADHLALAVIGFGSGAPAKIDSGGSVRNSRAGVLDYFTANTDTFGGNSGSGVFDRTTYKQVGLLVRGDTDYVQSSSGSCNVVNVCPSDGCSGESITYVYRAVQAYCDTGVTSLLCGNAPDQCGDGRCTGSETTTSCAGDCPVPATTGDGGAGGVPADWTCDPATYSDRATCDCGCGAYDPDCNTTDLPITGCASGEICDSSGVCSAYHGCEVPKHAAPPAREESDLLALGLGALAVLVAARLGRLARN